MLASSLTWCLLYPPFSVSHRLLSLLGVSEGSGLTEGAIRGVLSRLASQPRCLQDEDLAIKTLRTLAKRVSESKRKVFDCTAVWGFLRSQKLPANAMRGMLDAIQRSVARPESVEGETKNQYHVLVRLASGERTKITLDPGATVADLKEAVEEEMGVDPSAQVLFLSSPSPAPRKGKEKGDEEKQGKRHETAGAPGNSAERPENSGTTKESISKTSLATQEASNNAPAPAPRRLALPNDKAKLQAELRAEAGASFDLVVRKVKYLPKLQVFFATSRTWVPESTLANVHTVARLKETLSRREGLIPEKMKLLWETRDGDMLQLDDDTALLNFARSGNFRAFHVQLK